MRGIDSILLRELHAVRLPVVTRVLDLFRRRRASVRLRFGAGTNRVKERIDRRRRLFDTTDGPGNSGKLSGDLVQSCPAFAAWALVVFAVGDVNAHLDHFGQAVKLIHGSPLQAFRQALLDARSSPWPGRPGF